MKFIAAGLRGLSVSEDIVAMSSIQVEVEVAKSKATELL